jgi:hypothetical protein
MSDFSFNELSSLIRESLEEKFPVLLEKGPVSGIKGETEEQTITLPKFRISENWGDPDSEDREIITRYMQNIEGTTMAEKLKSVEGFLKDCDEACVREQSIKNIMSNLVFLEVMASLIQDFNDSTAGFLFEAFLAAIIGGEQEATVGGRYQPIEDVIKKHADDTVEALSLKLIKPSPGTVGGNVRNLVTALKNPKFGGKVKYVVAHKISKGDSMAMDFFIFTVGLAGSEADIIIDVEEPTKSKKQLEVDKTNDLIRRSLKKKLKKDNSELSEKELDARVSKMMARSHAETRALKEARNPTKWSAKNWPLKPAQYGDFKVASFDAGSREDLKKLAQKYTEKLSGSLSVIFSNLQQLTDNINLYYAGETGKGLEASKNADTLREETNKLV